MPELKRITFSAKTAVAYVKTTIKGTRKTNLCYTIGRAGTDRISLWRELCVIMVRKKVAVDADLDRIRAALDKNELPFFADVRSICPGEHAFLCCLISLLISCAVLAGAKLEDLNGSCRGVAAATNLRPAAAAATPQPAQKQPSVFDMLMSGSKKLSEKAKGKQKAKAAALPLGRALLSASLPLSSKKREHQLTVPELSTAAGPSGTGVSERQIRRDTAAMQEFAFKQTADNPARMAAAIAGLMRYPAMQPHLPTEYTQQYTEEQQAAMLVGYNTRDSIQEVTAFGAKATATETQHKNSLYRGALTGEEAEHGQISQFSRFMQQSRRKVAKHSSSKRKAVEGGNLSGDLAPKRKKRCDATAGDPIFTEIWHTFSEQVKGQRGTKRKHQYNSHTGQKMAMS